MMAPMTVVEAILGGAALAAALLYGIAYGVRAGMAVEAAEQRHPSIVGRRAEGVR